MRDKGKRFVGRYKDTEATFNIIGTFENDGISGKWQVDEYDFYFGVVQKGGRLVIDYGIGELHHGVMNGDRVIFQLEYVVDGDVTEKATYSGVLRTSKTGPIISGQYFTENLETDSFVAKRVPVDAKDEITYDVMISYRSTDGKFINLLQNSLENSGITCWRDRRMEVGSNWSEDITHAVRSSKGVICCLSENYVKSSLCTKEVMMAHDMGKIILPLVLPTTDKKEQEWDMMVRAAYSSAHPPHVVAREIAKTSWLDFRPFSVGADPTDATTFEQRYPIVSHLKNQINNMKRKGCLWDLDGTWFIKFAQDKTANSLGIASFEAHTSFKHTKFELSARGAIHVPDSTKNIPVEIEDAHLESSFLLFSIKFTNEDSKGEIIVKSMIAVDGKSFEGKWTALDVGEWCSESGVVSGKIAREKKKKIKK